MRIVHRNQKYYTRKKVVICVIDVDVNWRFHAIFQSSTQVTRSPGDHNSPHNALCQSCGNLYFIRILKCRTLTNCFSVVFRPGCPKFCVELRKLPNNLEKAKKEKIEDKKEGKNAKNMKGGFAKVKTGLKKIVLINSTIFAF